MPIPLGGILRAIVPPNSLVGRILAKLKGVVIKTPGGVEIELNRNQTIGGGPANPDLDKPHFPSGGFRR